MHLIRQLGDSPLDTAADGPGVYAREGDEEAVRAISGALGCLLYVAQAGAAV